MRYYSTYTESGQITIPTPIAKALNLTPGQKIIFDLPEAELAKSHPIITISRAPAE